MKSYSIYNELILYKIKLIFNYINYTNNLIFQNYILKSHFLKRNDQSKLGACYSFNFLWTMQRKVLWFYRLEILL